MNELVLQPSGSPARGLGASDEGATDDPRRELRIGIMVAVGFFILFLGWAALSPMDAAASAPGVLQVSGQRQSVQHRDGGIVAAIRVKEGQKVRAGDVLIELAGSEVQGQERALASQMLNLLAQRERLKAEQLGLARVAWPASFAGLDVSPEERRAAIATQEQELNARRSLLAAQGNVLSQQAAQSGQSATGFGSQMVSSVEQARLIDEELKSLREVAEKGFVSQSRIRALERAKAQIEGERGRYQASVAESRLAAGTSRLRQLEARNAFRERAANELKEVTFAIDELTPKYLAARDQLRRLQIRAPASGTVVGLSIFTEGGVISAGQRLMDIVPDRAELVVAARVSPNDVDDLSVGMTGELRFSGLHDRNLPVLSGTMTQVSADALTDEKTGESFYTVEFKVPEAEMAKIQGVRGQEFKLPAGAPVEVLIPTRKRTALQYMFEPLTDMLRRSGREN